MKKRTIVFRQSCIYGYRQIGLEDQGWLAWFSIRNILNKKINVYGNGKQVRDVLFIDDLLCAYDSAVRKINITKGRIYNIGGGSCSTLSLLEALKLLEEISGRDVKIDFKNWRLGDQKVFVSNINLAKKDFNWSPKISPKEGLTKLYKWLLENKHLYS